MILYKYSKNLVTHWAYLTLIFDKKWEVRPDAEQLRQRDLVGGSEIQQSNHYGLLVYGVEEWNVLSHAVGLGEMKELIRKYTEKNEYTLLVYEYTRRVYFSEIVQLHQI